MKYENQFQRFNGRETNGQAHTISRLPSLDEKVGLHDLIEFPHCAYINISSFCLEASAEVELGLQDNASQ
jgi:hypothetical protein